MFLPQMAPMWWCMLMFMFLMSFMMLMYMLYFNFENKNYKSIMKNMINMNWKW